jgi:hypothetical protein
MAPAAPAQQNRMIPSPAAPSRGFNQPAPQMMAPPAQPSAPKLQEQISSPPQPSLPAPGEAALPNLNQAGPEIVSTPAAAPITSKQMMAMPNAINPLQGLANFLEQNVVLSENADRNEFAQKLEALKSLGLATAQNSQNQN